MMRVLANLGKLITISIVKPYKTDLQTNYNLQLPNRHRFLQRVPR